MIKVLVSTSVNSNPEYAFYIPYFIDFWRFQNSEEFSFIPEIVCINFTPYLSSDHSKFCRSVFLDCDLSEVTLSQLARFTLIPESQYDFLVTTDIDMLPLSPSPFERAIELITNSNSQFMVMRDVLPPGQYAICYNIASPFVWRELLRHYFHTNEFVEIIKLIETNMSIISDWYLDQKLLYAILHSQETFEIIYLTDSDTGLNRLDRGKHAFPINWIILATGAVKKFTEYHSARPSCQTKLYLSALRKRVKRGT